MRKELIVIGIVALVIAGYFLFPGVKDVVINNQTPTPDPYTGWNTYTNEEYGFSLRYPFDWYALDSDGHIPTFSSSPELTDYQSKQLMLGVRNHPSDEYDNNWPTSDDFINIVTNLSPEESVNFNMPGSETVILPYKKIEDFEVDGRVASLIEDDNSVPNHTQFRHFWYIVLDDQVILTMYVPNVNVIDAYGIVETIYYSNEDLTVMQETASKIMRSVKFSKL